MNSVQLAGLHRAAAHEYGGDIQSHGGHKHTRGNLVAVAYAHQRIGLVGIHHILHTVSDYVT